MFLVNGLNMMIDFFKTLFCGCPQDYPSYGHLKGRTEMILNISLYNLDYEITDKKTGEELECDLVDYDETNHNIKIYKYAKFVNQ